MQTEKGSTRTVYCRSKGQLIGDTVEKLERWSEYFEDLLNDKTEEEQHPKVVKTRRQENNEKQEKIEEPTRQEVSKMIQEVPKKMEYLQN